MICTLEWYDEDSRKWCIQHHSIAREGIMMELRALKDDGVDVETVAWRMGTYDLVASEPLSSKALKMKGHDDKVKM